MTPRSSRADQEILARHVAPLDPTTLGWRSTFAAAVHEARLLTGRELDTGRRDDKEATALWAGTIVYLVLLEQIGKSLQPVGGERHQGEKELERAIRQFAGDRATEMERQALYALRCALAHEFGLLNRSRTPYYRRLFRLEDTPGGPLVVQPARDWTEHPEDWSPFAITEVNLLTLGDLAEEVVQSVRDHAERGDLRAQVSLPELQRRFSFYIS